MTHQDRRHTRYAIPEHIIVHQLVKRHGLIGAISGWGPCRIKDISYAGLLLLTDKKMTIGDKIQVRIALKSGSDLMFACDVVNASSDHASGGLKVGVQICEPGHGSEEHKFLVHLDQHYQPTP